jgi:hypothetical protein
MLILIAVPAPAAAVSMADLIELSRAGLSDDVLVALVEADNTSFGLDAPKILELRQQGLSERVITAMLKSGRTQERRAPAFPADANAVCSGCAPAGQPQAAADEPPSLVIIGAQKEEPPAPEPQQVIVMPWVYPVVGVPGHHPPRHVLAPRTPYRGFGRFINDGFVDGTTTINAR